MLKFKCNNEKFNNIIIFMVKFISWCLILGVLFHFLLSYIHPLYSVMLQLFQSLSLGFKWMFIVFLKTFLIFAVLFNAVLFSVFLPWEFNKFAKAKNGACNAIKEFIIAFLQINSIFILFVLCDYFLYPNDFIVLLSNKILTFTAFLLIMLIFNCINSKWYKD